MPQLGESIAEATVVRHQVQTGREGAADQEIIEVETNKAVMGVTPPVREVATIDAQVKETYPIGAVLVTSRQAKRCGRFTKQTAAEVRREKFRKRFGTCGQRKGCRQKNRGQCATAELSTDRLPVPAARKVPVFYRRAARADGRAGTYRGRSRRNSRNGSGIACYDQRPRNLPAPIESQTTSDASAIRKRRCRCNAPQLVATACHRRFIGQPRPAAERIVKQRDGKPGPALYALRALALALAEIQARRQS